MRPTPAELALNPHLQPSLASGLLVKGDAPRALSRDAAGSPPRRRRRRRGAPSLIPTYFRYPPLKPSHWRWLVVCYFFIGGIAGFSQALAAIARLGPRGRNRGVVRAGRYLALAGAASAPVLLTLDLHMPQRFHHMLRIVKNRSAMSLGSWILASFGVACGMLGAKQMADDGLLDRLPGIPRIARRVPDAALAPVAGALGIGVASYTGVLLSATNVPVWAAQSPLLGPLFLASAASASSAALRLATLLDPSAERQGREVGSTRAGATGPAGDHDDLARFETVSVVVELSLLVAAVARSWPVARPLLGGPIGVATLGAACGTVSPLLVHLLAGRGREEPRALTVLASAATLAGGFLLRAAYVFAGRESASNPEDYFRYADG